ncbi:Aste57867_10242 [Aphanomyces stellatus]|uniref:Aste57867_10242 protein n=1 Tax=Aphanomyces stellatus TaxID=120398 RepID=A0A485KQV4_9STRA|nr:hypothetical protein As57867_010203 [Aphanomyces stellatus]VFT87117.1 Aste57867_10242 [Aphanomyces stellatus]
MPELHVRAVSGRNLPVVFGQQVPLCKLQVNNQIHKTSVHNASGGYPVWNERFTFHAINPHADVILITIEDWRSNGHIGMCRVPVNNLLHGQVVDQWLPVSRGALQGQGEVNIRMQVLGHVPQHHAAAPRHPAPRHHYVLRQQEVQLAAIRQERIQIQRQLHANRRMPVRAPAPPQQYGRGAAPNPAQDPQKAGGQEPQVNDVLGPANNVQPFQFEPANNVHPFQFEHNQPVFNPINYGNGYVDDYMNGGDDDYGGGYDDYGGGYDDYGGGYNYGGGYDNGGDYGGDYGGDF